MLTYYHFCVSTTSSNFNLLRHRNNFMLLLFANINTHHISTTLQLQTFQIVSGSWVQALHPSWQNQSNNFLPLHYHQSTKMDYMNTVRLCAWSEYFSIILIFVHKLKILSQLPKTQWTKDSLKH